MITISYLDSVINNYKEFSPGLHPYVLLSQTELDDLIIEYPQIRDKFECKKILNTKPVHYIISAIFLRNIIREQRIKDEKEKIQVGDEVIVQDDILGFVTGLSADNYFYVTTLDGWSDRFEKMFIKKTGRNFPQILDVLKEMKARKVCSTCGCINKIKGGIVNRCTFCNEFSEWEPINSGIGEEDEY